MILMKRMIQTVMTQIAIPQIQKMRRLMRNLKINQGLKRRIKRHRSQIIQMLPVKMINLNQMMVALQRMLIILKELLILPVKHKMEKYIQEIQIRLLVMHELVNTMCQDKLDII